MKVSAPMSGREPRGIQPLAAEYEQRYGQGEGDEKRKAHANDRRCGNGIDHYMSFPRGAGAPRRGDLVFYFMSSSGGTSSSFGAGEPFFLRWRTHSVRRYSICPLTERKSSSAHAAIASYSFADRRRGTCFFRVVRHISTACRS